MKIEVSNGELLDRISILEIKKLNMQDPENLANVELEFLTLNPGVVDLFTKNGAGTISCRTDESYIKKLLNYFKNRG